MNVKTIVDGIARDGLSQQGLMDVSKRCNLSPHLFFFGVNFTSSFDYTPLPPNLDLASAMLINAHYKVVSELLQLSNNT